MALAENGQVVFLQGTRSVDQGKPSRGGWAKRGETHLYTTAVIRDLQQLQATFLGKYLERCRAGVHGILHELLQSMHRGDDNLASSNLVDDIRVQGLDWVPVSNEH